MFFQPMTGPRPERQTFHLDLTVPSGSRQAEVERLLSLGATYQWDVLDEFPHVQWTTLADREGNLFCVAEHPPTDQQGARRGISSQEAPFSANDSLHVP